MALRFVLVTPPWNTERMFSPGESSSGRLGSHRLGGPVLFKDIWPALREELHEAYLANGGASFFDPVLAGPERPGAETASPSLSKAA